MCHKVTQSELDSATQASPQFAATLLLIEEIRRMNALMQQLCGTLRCKKCQECRSSSSEEDLHSLGKSLGFPGFGAQTIDGLLDLETEDDTSLGAELLDEIYNSDEESVSKHPVTEHPKGVVEEYRDAIIGRVRKSLEGNNDG